MVVGGEYAVNEDGLKLKHNPNVPFQKPCSPEEFLIRFRNDFEMNILEQTDENTLIIEFKQCDTSFVNALRRILLSEIPTVAIEYVYMWNNSSIIHDEILSHRLGLIPLHIHPKLLEDIIEDQNANTNNNADDDDVPNNLKSHATDRNTIVFSLSVSCPSNPSKDKNSNKKQQRNMDDDDDDVVQSSTTLEEVSNEAAIKNVNNNVQYPKNRPYTKHVYTKDMKWVPQGDQVYRYQKFYGNNTNIYNIIKPIHDDILIAKLRPGQSIELEAHAKRGIGKDHAKYSPVATASYRLMPKIELLYDIYDDLAEELVYIYEPGVFQLIPTTSQDPPDTKQKVELINPYACTMSRNYMRNPELAKSIRMSRIADHFIFSIESVGAYKPSILLAEALKVLQYKCQYITNLINETSQRVEPM